METFLIIFAVLIVFLTAMLTVSVNFNYDVLSNIGNVRVRIFKYITVFNSKVTVIGDYLNFSNKKAKVIKIKLDINDFSLQFFNEFSSYIKQKVIPIKLVANGQICFENALVVSIFSAVLKLITSIVLLKMQLNNRDLEVENNIVSGYRHNIVILKLEFAFAITLYDLLWSIIRSIIVIRRRNEKETKHTEQHPQQNYS